MSIRMCERCANIDYPIGDAIWLPCGGSSERYRARPTRRGYGEEDFEADRIIVTLRHHLKKSEQRNKMIVAENELLKARQPPTDRGSSGFEPISGE